MIHVVPEPPASLLPAPDAAVSLRMRPQFARRALPRPEQAIRHRASLPPRQPPTGQRLRQTYPRRG